MLKYLVGFIGVACLAGSPLFGQTACQPCQPCQACQSCQGGGGCGGQCGCQECGHCCPHCGCKLVPVCHCGCDVKKTVTYEYRFVCKDLCVPGPGCCCGRCAECESGQCAAGCATGCENGNGCCNHDFGCGCSVYTAKKLVKFPVIKETPVRTCTVEWTCPSCGGCCGQCEAAPVPGAAPVAPPAVAPAPPAPAKSADVAPLPAVVVSFNGR